ncbi:MAG: biliverdin-producing heme oxygenase [Bdellovibrionaceae bacterium]|nr:biliverdin-producing heme oxygenase [Pseudobdellovibrionaceae bacterium]
MSFTVETGNPGLRDVLKERTRQAHLETEKAMDLMSPHLDVARYRHLLRGFFEFHAAFEEFLNVHRKDWPSAVEFYFKDRRKMQWLTEDLQSLGADALPSAERIQENFQRLNEKIRSEAQLWAAIYVIEGSTMGGQVLHGHVTASLGLSEGKGTRYFRSYQSEMGKQWVRFLSELNSLTLAPDGTESAVKAADEIFEMFKEIGS